MISRRATLFAILAMTLPAAAADDGLYEDVFDPNSSFVRVLAPDQTFASVAGKTLRDLEGGLSAYVNVMPGAVPVTLADVSQTIEVGASTHYTVMAAPDGGLSVVVDTLELSPAKSDLTVFNLTSRGDVELYVPLARAVAIPEVLPQASSSVALKAPLTLDFDLRSGGAPLASVEAVALRRKSGVTIVLTEQGGSFNAVAVPNAYFQ